MTSIERPPRTLGLSIAILLSVVLYSALPLLPVITIITLRIRFQSFCEALPTYLTEEFCAAGIDPLGLNEPLMALMAVLGIAFLFIAILAWQGNPPVIRQLHIGAVLVLTLLVMFIYVTQLLRPASLDNLQTSLSGLLCAVLPPYLLGPLYIVWYLTRAPARAFYRGYYLTPLESPPPTEAVPAEQEG